MVKHTAHNGRDPGSSPVRPNIIVLIYFILISFGGTGRRDGLKIHSSHGGIGSTPIMSTR
jgi:hypothetical protein